MIFNQNEDSVIKEFGVYIPLFRVEVDALSKALGASQKDINDLKKIIGEHRRIAVADMTYMDPVVLALNAFEKMRKTSEKLKVPTDYNNVQMVLGGTEDPPDKSKPTMALMIQEHFNMPSNIGVVHDAAACNVGGSMLLAARDFTTLRPGAEAIVAMADIARYNPDDHNAYKKSVTPGAGGATFLLGNADLNNEEWLMQLCKPGLEGLYAKSVQDFWFPDRAHYPEVNGLLSCWCYHLGFLGALADHFKKLDCVEGEKSIEERIEGYNMIVPHIPFVNQARDAFCLFYSGRVDEKIETLEQAILNEVENPKDEDNRKRVEKMINSSRTSEAMNKFNKLTKYWQNLPIQVGNSYSVSLPASLVYGLQQMKQRDISQSFKILLVFFGSGLQATAISAKISPFAIKYAQALDPLEMVMDGIILSPQMYLNNIRQENPESFGLHPEGYFMRTSVERGYPHYLKIK